MFGAKTLFEEALALYVGEQVVDRIRRNGKNALRREVEKVELTLLMQDIKPFTTFSEKLTSEKLTELMNDYSDVMAENILENGGVIACVLGDSILAYWESHADRAIVAVKRAKEIGRELSEKWKGVVPQDIIPIIGIDHGSVMRGNFGSKHRMNFSVVGDTVNFTARLCSANRHYGTQSIFSDRARRVTKTEGELKLVDNIVVKGRSDLEQLFSLEDPVPSQNK